MLFDLDGTLIDTIELIVSSARHAFAEWPHRRPTDAEWIQGIGTPLVAQLRAYATSDDDVPGLLDRYRAFQLEHHDRLTRSYEGVPAVVAELAHRGHALAIVTSKASPIAYRSLAYVGLDRFFPVMVGYDETARHKPNPDPVLLALERLGATPDEAVFVGDSPHDIQAGRAAGVMTVAALWGPFGRETLAAAGPNHLIECLSELLPILDRDASS